MEAGSCGAGSLGSSEGAGAPASTRGSDDRCGGPLASGGSEATVAPSLWALSSLPPLLPGGLADSVAGVRGTSVAVAASGVGLPPPR